MTKATEKKGTEMLNLLLSTDPAKVKAIPTGKASIPRYIELCGSPLEVSFHALSPDKIQEMEENCVTYRSGEPQLDVAAMQVFTVLEAVTEPNFRNKELMAHYNAATPIDLIKMLFLPGEITQLYNRISNLSGFGQGAVEEIKNLSTQTEHSN